MTARGVTLLGFLLVTVAALSLGGIRGQEALRYAHPNSTSDVPGQFAALLARSLAERTGGEMAIEVYPSSQLGGVREMIEGAQLGIISMGHNSFAALSQFLPEIAVFNFPFLFEDVDHALAATDPLHSPILMEFNEQLIERSNLRIIGSFFFGIRRLTTSNFPVYSPTDLRGRRIRAIPNPIWIAMVEGFGAIPTPVDFAELPTALATGIVDGQENPVNTIYTSQMYATQGYLILTDHMIDILLVYMNNEVYESLSPEHREALHEAQREAADEVRRVSEALQESRIAELEARGMRVVSAADGLDIEAFRRAADDHVLATFPEWREHVERIRAMAVRDTTSRAAEAPGAAGAAGERPGRDP